MGEVEDRIARRKLIAEHQLHQPPQQSRVAHLSQRGLRLPLVGHVGGAAHALEQGLEGRLVGVAERHVQHRGPDRRIDRLLRARGKTGLRFPHDRLVPRPAERLDQRPAQQRRVGGFARPRVPADPRKRRLQEARDVAIEDGLVARRFDQIAQKAQRAGDLVPDRAVALSTEVLHEREIARRFDAPRLREREGVREQAQAVRGRETLQGGHEPLEAPVLVLAPVVACVAGVREHRAAALETQFLRLPLEQHGAPRPCPIGEDHRHVPGKRRRSRVVESEALLGEG